MKPDGSDITCLTCGKAALSKCGHRGQPFWHPGGDYTTFTAENDMYPRKGNGTSARPGIGRNHNVWIMTSDGKINKTYKMVKRWRLPTQKQLAEKYGVSQPAMSSKIKTWATRNPRADGFLQDRRRSLWRKQQINESELGTGARRKYGLDQDFGETSGD